MTLVEHGGVMEGLSKLLRSIQERFFKHKHHLTKFLKKDNKTEQEAPEKKSQSDQIREHHAEKRENEDLRQRIENFLYKKGFRSFLCHFIQIK